MFNHALTHDVAYSTLLGDRRKALHRAVAAAITDLYADRLDERWGVLAHHHEAAEDWPQALACLLRAWRAGVGRLREQGRARPLRSRGRHRGPAGRRGPVRAGGGAQGPRFDALRAGRSHPRRGRLRAAATGGAARQRSRAGGNGAAVRRVDAHLRRPRRRRRAALSRRAGAGRRRDAGAQGRDQRHVGQCPPARRPRTPGGGRRVPARGHGAGRSDHRPDGPGVHGHHEHRPARAGRDASTTRSPLQRGSGPLSTAGGWRRSRTHCAGPAASRAPGRGDYRAAMDELAAVLAVCERNGDALAMGRCLNTLGWIHGDLQDPGSGAGAQPPLLAGHRGA